MTKEIFVLVASLVLLASACSTKKTAMKRGPIPEHSNAEVLQALQQHNYDFEWFASEASMDVDSPQQSISAKCYIRIRKDSVIWSVVKRVGVEGGRILVTPDLYASINRIDGTYQRGSTVEVLAKMGLDFDFYDAQQALFGNIILPDTNQLSILKDNEHYIATAPTGDLLMKYWVNAFDLKIDRILLSDSYARQIDVSYGNYQDVDGIATLAFDRRYTIVDPNTGTTSIDLQFKKVSIDIPKSTKFTIPPHYEEVD